MAEDRKFPLSLHRCTSTVLMYRSTMLSDCGCRGVVRVLITPSRCRTSCIRRDSKLRPSSLCSYRDNTKREKLVTSVSATPTPLDWEWCKSPITCWNIAIRRYYFPWSLREKGSPTSKSILTNGPRIMVCGPRFAAQVSQRRKTSRRRVMPGTSSTSAWISSVSRWRPRTHLTVNHGVRAARPSLCSEGGLSGLFW
jgi:hypothetical protein